ncbi:MAG: PEGA domain-containing protein [Spirochaetaceae bacterium]|jgi:outer membrane protein assembly factor BamD (BamD/ComL family)|nr:PEGA domain-containing protein [Spirochaetaceae bacterium]
MHFEQNIIKIFINIILIIILILPLSAESSLFITSNPLGASITVDGTPRSEKTPMLIRNMENGTYLIEVIGEGYYPLKKRIVIDSEVPQVYNFDLLPEFITATIHQNEIANKTVKIPPGSYLINDDENGMNILPQYPHQEIINGFNLVIPILSAFSIGLTVNEVLDPQNDQVVISPFVIATYIINSLLISTDIAFYIHKSSYMKKQIVNISTTFPQEELIEKIYNTANALLEKGDFNSALKEFEIIRENYKLSLYYPLTVYKTGSIKMILFNLDGAEEDFKLIINKFPMPEVYDSSLRKLVEIGVRKLKYDTALEYLNRILYIQNYPTREDIQLRKCEILNLWSKIEPEILYDSIKAWRNIIEEYPESEKNVIYRYSLAQNLATLDLKEEALEELEKINTPIISSSLLNNIIILKEELIRSVQDYPDEY